MNIVVTGSIAYDYLMRFPGRFVEVINPAELHQVSLSFLVDDMTKHWGGVAANISYTMACLGLKPKLMGTVGRDFSDYNVRLKSYGVDTSTVRRHDEVFTASFFCNTDEDNNQIASFYSGAMALAKHYSLADACDTTPDLVVISPNDPDAMTNLCQECRDMNIPFIYDPSQQIARLNGHEIERDLAGSHAMVVNAYEASIIMEKTGMTMLDMRREIDLLVITHGKEGAKIYTNGDIVQVDVFPTEKILDPTGAGDAFRAGFIAGLVMDMPLQVAGEMGSLCASYDLEHIGTQNHFFTPGDFVERYRSHFDDAGELDKLLEEKVSS